MKKMTKLTITKTYNIQGRFKENLFTIKEYKNFYVNLNPNIKNFLRKVKFEPKSFLLTKSFKTLTQAKKYIEKEINNLKIILYDNGKPYYNSLKKY